MDTKKLAKIRLRLSREYENLEKSINHSRLAAEEIKVENTEDEGDLATISHNESSYTACTMVMSNACDSFKKASRQSTAVDTGNA